MTTPLSKLKDLDEVQLRGMIRMTAKKFPFLDATSEDVTYALARLMIDTDFVIDRQPTPVCSSLEFLKSIGPSHGIDRVAERDLVFLIKMFGLRIRDKIGLMEFLPRNEWIGDADGEKPSQEVFLDDREAAKHVEYSISQVHKPRKIHSRRIDAGFNRLSRLHRNTELAHVFVKLHADGKSIGEAKDILRDQFKVKDHEYNRVRERALELGIFDPSRNKRRANGRVTLDPEVMGFIEKLASEQQGGRLHTKTPSQMVNQVIRDFHFLTKKTTLNPAPKTARSVK